MKNFLMIVCCTLAMLLLSSTPICYAVSDNFDDLDDTNNPTWSHLSGYVASHSQTWSAATGQYRMTAPNNGASNFGFVGSYAGAVETDVVVTSDIVSFVDLGMPPAGPLEGGPFGIAARLNGNNAVGGLRGYAYIYEPATDGGNGEFALVQIGPGVAIGDLGSLPGDVEGVDYIRKVTLDPAKDYTFSLRIVGNHLYGEAREVGGPIVAYQDAIDVIVPMVGDQNIWTSGFSGYIAFSQGPTTANPRGLPPTDVTWDNFSSTSIPEPSSLLLLVTAVGFLGFKRRLR